MASGCAEQGEVVAQSRGKWQANEMVRRHRARQSTKRKTVDVSNLLHRQDLSIVRGEAGPDGGLGTALLIFRVL